MTYDDLRQQTNQGWNTWYSRSMTAHVLLPCGFGIRLDFKDFASERLICDLKVGEHGLRPGLRSWDGRYTELTFTAGKTEIRVESTAHEGEQYILVTPEDHGAVRAPAAVAQAVLLFGKPGCLWSRDGRIGAQFEDGREIEIFTSGKRDRYVHPDALGPCFSVTLDAPAVFSTRPASVGEVRIPPAKCSCRSGGSMGTSTKTTTGLMAAGTTCRTATIFTTGADCSAMWRLCRKE